VTVVGSLAVGEALLILKILFLLLLYLFIWRIVRTASRDLRLPQESFVLAPDQAAGLLGGSKPVNTGRLVFPDGRKRGIDSRTLLVGRGADNDIPLDDDFASARHARLEPRRDGVWVSDAGSTNGTIVNGKRIERAVKLRRGDRVQLGETLLEADR